MGKEGKTEEREIEIKGKGGREREDKGKGGRE